MNNELKPGMNTGVLIVPPKPTDWMAGGETGIAAAVLEESGQYDTYLPDEESQITFDPVRQPILDTSACVTFSGLNNVETLINRLRAKGLVPATAEAFLKSEGYVNPATGKVNFSDRFTAKMSGTTKAGNSLGAVGDSIRKLHGLLPESDWMWPDMSDLQGDANYDARWNRYYAEIPTALQTKAKRFLDHFDIFYQWVALGTSTPEQLKASLKQGPFQIAAAICSPWSSNDGMPPILACGCGTGHATLVYGFQPDGAWKDFDHYKSFRKLLAVDYCIPYALQYAVLPKVAKPPEEFSYTFSKKLRYDDPKNDAAEVHKLQEALQFLKRADGQPYLKVGVFGPFGPQTKTAFGLFQTDHKITDPDGQGTNFGPQSRAVMNQELLK